MFFVEGGKYQVHKLDVKIMHKDPFYKSLGYAISGIIHCIQKERNIKIHFLFMFLVVICGFIFHLSVMEWFICILLFALVISLELVNTAIEAVVDLCTHEIHPLAKTAKRHSGRGCAGERDGFGYYWFNDFYSKIV